MTSKRGALSALRRFTRAEPAADARCDLCNAAIGSEHPHLLEVAARRLVCACPGCALLFPGHEGARYRSVVTTLEPLTDVRLAESDWGELGVPVRFVFLCASRTHERIYATYPNPGGAAESELPRETWSSLVQRYPRLSEIEPDVAGVFLDGLTEDEPAYELSIDVFQNLMGQIAVSGGSPRAAWRIVKERFTSAKGAYA
jgi:hypothetical protein